MTDSALWISSLTAGTAVLASWVTSRGTSRAAQIQADAAENVRLSTRPPYRALEASIAGDTNAPAAFDQCYDPFWQSVLTFVSTARAAVHDM